MIGNLRIAVLTMTRDRLAYTRHCFQTLRDNAGAPYDHYVLDQASTDGTEEWLEPQRDIDVTYLEENIGICRGLNLLLDEAVNPKDYDCIVRLDNDCEVWQPNTLRVLCDFAVDYETILSPKVMGLRSPPPIMRRYPIGDHWVDEPHHLGGIFMAIPAQLFEDFRYDESQPPWGGDELICPWYRERGGQCGYLKGWSVNHFLSTEGQERENPEYLARKLLEMRA